MPNRRYHIHVICAINDQPLFLNEVAIFFQSRAFLTYDVASTLSRSTLYSRQCIDTCDYTLLVVGDSYGSTHSKGVSQMHLSYLSAKAKLKQMIILIKTQEEDTTVTRQLQDFRRLVEQQANRVYYYDAETDLEQLLSYAYENMVDKHPSAGWTQGSEVIEVPIQPLITPKAKTSLSYFNTETPEPSAEEKMAAAFDNVTESLALNDEVCLLIDDFK